MAKPYTQQSNMGVDYVIVFRFATTDKPKAEARLGELLQRLAGVGLATEVRNGEKHSVLIFVRVISDEHMFGEVYRSRVKDWIHGVRSAEPAKETRNTLEQDPLTEAERLRIIYQLITNAQNEGGAGITPQKGEWVNIESVFALHDHEYNKQWILRWSKQWLLTTEDMDDIRNRLGEKVAFYFAFTQWYFVALTVPAGLGLLAWTFLGFFSPIFAVVVGLWSVIFVEYWKHQEHDLAVRWGVRGVGSIETKRHEFKPTTEEVDPVTGEKQQVFSSIARLQRQLLQVPFAIVAFLGLGALITLCFGIDVFISEVYSGPFKSYLSFLPTIIITTALPMLTGVLTTFAKRLNDFENYATASEYETALTAKIFVINFITSYLGVLLTAFVYLPFGAVIVPYLDVFSLAVKPFAENEKQLQTPKPHQFTINPSRLRNQVFYLTVTAQVVNFAMEVVVPYLKRQGLIRFKEMQSQRAQKGGGAAPSAAADDLPDEKEFLARVRSEATLEVYDVYTDLREMVLQYGYLALFSVIWPLAPVSFLINNWIELRADAVKICVEMQRPTPWRADTIGPWLDALGFLTWLGSITMAALVYLFSNDGVGPDGKPYDINAWALLLAIFFSEHLYLLTKSGVALAISKIDSPGRQKARRDRYLTRQKYFEESLDQTRRIPALSEKTGGITRSSLEDDARQSSLKTATPEEHFWTRQQGWQESAQIGKGLIQRALPDEKEVASAKKQL